MPRTFPFRSLVHAFAVILAAALLSGCAIGAADLRHQDTERAGLSAYQSQRALTPQRVQPVAFRDTIYTASYSMPYVNGDPLPPDLRAREVVFRTSSPMDARDAADHLQTILGIPVSVDLSAPGGAVGSGGSAGSEESGSPGSPNDVVFELPPPPVFDDPSGTAMPGVASRPVAATVRRTINFSGALEDLLDEMANYYDMHWEYDRGQIEFKRYVTRVFTISALVGTSTTTAGGSAESSSDSLSGTSGSSAAAGDVRSDLETKASIDIWNDIKGQLETILPGGSTFRLSPSMQSLTVVTTPSAMRLVDDVVNKHNDILNRMVGVSIRVFRVSRDHSDQFAIDVEGALANLTDSYFTGGIAGAAAGAIANSGSLSVNIVDGRYAGSGLLLQALSEAGRASLDQTLSVTALNGRPVQQLILNRRNYVREVSSLISDGISETSIEAGEVVSGTTLLLTPIVRDNGEIFLDISLGISSLDRLDSFSSGDATVQQPQLSQRIAQHQVRIASGDTLILSGLQAMTSNRSTRGPGLVDAWFLGGRNTGEVGDETFVIALTPTVM
jgi:type IVB pilus formation R64 PilN family outer membrane protein